MNPVLEIIDLVKKYPDVCAVDRVSFGIRPGICFGLLGPNGAGKTTTIEIAEGIRKATSGKILYKGLPRSKSFQEEIGIQFQATELLAHLTVRESLETFSKFYKNPMKIDQLSAMCHLDDILERDNDKISGGQKQRLLLAIALVNNPNLVFLDEPTTGLDPQARRHLWDIVEQIKSEGKTIVLTTHYMEEAQKLCEEIAIVDMGRVIALGSPAFLLEKYSKGTTIEIPEPAAPGRETLDALENYEGTRICPNRSENGLEIQTKNANACLAKLMDAGVDLSKVTVRSFDLEDLFLKLTGRQLRH